MKAHTFFRALAGLVFWLLLAAEPVVVQAQSPAVQVVLSAANPCASVVLKTDFTANAGQGVYCLKGQRFGSFLAIPGAAFTRASTETCQWASGLLTTATAGVPCVTDLGLAVWESRTNSFLNNAVGVTQSVTTTAAAWTLSLYGTGSITLSGNCAGTLNGTGASVRVTLTATCTAGSTTLTVAGSTTNVQYEAGGFATPVIVTVGATATRAGDVASIGGLATPTQGTLRVLATFDHSAPGTESVAGVGDGTANNRIDMMRVTGDGMQFRDVVAGVAANPGNLTGPFAAGTHSVAMTWTSARAIAAVNSVLSTASTPTGVPAISQIGIGTSSTLSGAANAYVRRVIFDPRALSDSAL